MRLPWWAKVGSKIVLARLPVEYRLWQRLGLFRHGAMDDCEYAIRVFDGHAARMGIAGRLRGLTILELGPGDSVATAVVAAAHGARADLVDTGTFVRSEVDLYLRLADTLRARGLVPPDLDRCTTVDDVLVRCGARYLTTGLPGLRQLKTASADAIFSHAVLEHVRRCEMRELMRECRRILKPGRMSSHQIDLRDHLGGALNSLRFSERTWEGKLFSSSGFYTNRLRYSQLLAIFRDARFEIQDTAVSRWQALPTPKRKLAPEFRELPDDELCVSGFTVALR